MRRIIRSVVELSTEDDEQICVACANQDSPARFQLVRRANYTDSKCSEKVWDRSPIGDASV